MNPQRWILYAALAILAAAGLWSVWAFTRPEPRADRLQVTYLYGSGTRKAVLAREAITDPERIETFLRGIDAPDESAVGVTRCCSFDIQLEFLKEGRCVLSGRLTADGCGKMWVYQGKVAAAGQSGLLVPPHSCVKDLVARQRELTQKARLAAATP
jgi:hypothetical protein